MKERGFTLTELIITIVLTGIVAGLGVSIASAVFKGYAEAKIKNFLFTEAQFVVERIDRELRSALPNSIRVGDSYIQYVLIKDGFFYEESSTSQDNITIFQDNLTSELSIGDNLSIYNLSFSDIYTDTYKKVYGLQQITPNSSDNWSVKLSKPLIADSPYRRAFLILTPVTIYKENNNILKRCFNYPLGSSTGIGEGICNVMSQYVKDVSFEYESGFTMRNAVVKISLLMEKSDITLRYDHEVHLRNVP